MENKCSFDSLLLRNEKVEISQYTKQGFPYVIGKTPKSSPIRSPLLLLRATNKYPPLSTSPFSADERYADERQSRWHRLSPFLAELVVFGIGKVEIIQNYLTACRASLSLSLSLSLWYRAFCSPITIKAAVTGFPLFLAELVVSGIGKVEKLQYYLMPGLLPPCHGLSTFLVELVAFDIGKVEISQYYLTRLRTEKSKYYKSNSRHAGPS